MKSVLCEKALVTTLDLDIDCGNILNCGKFMNFSSSLFTDDNENVIMNNVRKRI